MRQFLVLCLIALAAWAPPAAAASLDPNRGAAIDQAAADFLARAAELHKTGQVPRQADPAVGALLDTVFDTSDLTHGAVPYADFDKLSNWLGKVVAVGDVYLAASRAVRDFGVFASELGRFFDASVVLQQAMADCLMAELDARPGEKLSPADQTKLTQLRGKMAGALEVMIGLLHSPGLTVGWIQGRLAVLRAAAPTLARFLTPEQVAHLRATLLRVAAVLRDKNVRLGFSAVAVALAAPAPPFAVPAPASSAEIALESTGEGLMVPARINGATTVKFVVDSGAGIVALPADLVETMTKSGAIASGDLLGRGTYVTADGRRHHGVRLMLREVDVGGHTVTNVVAMVAPAHAAPLLGQTFLAKFRSWTLDNRRHVLIIAE